MMNNMKMMNDMDLELVTGGNAIEKTVDSVVNNGVVDYVVDSVCDAASTAWEVVKYVLFG